MTWSSGLSDGEHGMEWNGTFWGGLMHFFPAWTAFTDIQARMLFTLRRVQSVIAQVNIFVAEIQVL